MSSTGIRKKDSFEKRIVDVLKSDEQEFIQSYKVTTVEKGSGGVVALGETASGGTRDPPGNFLPTSGGEMKGPIGYVPQTVTIVNDASIDNDTINIGLEDGVSAGFSSYVLIEGATTSDDLENIIGDVFEGQRLFLQTKVGDTITIEDFSNNTTGNIITSDGNNVVVDSSTFIQIITLIFDSAATPNGNVGGWRIVTNPAAGGGGGSVPDGTAVNDHLEWDGAAWQNEQTFGFGAGVLGSAGFLRFANNDIIWSIRDFGDTQQHEFKVTEGNFNEFSRTENGQPVTLQLKTDHDTQGEQNAQITQLAGNVGPLNIATPDFINFQVPSTFTRMQILPTGATMLGNDIRAVDHIEFDNTPFGSSGGLRFANNEIIFSSRNLADDGNLEFKVDAGDFFDFFRTEDLQPIVLRLRARDGGGEQQGLIQQLGGSVGAMILDTPDFINFRILSDTKAQILPTGISMLENTIIRSDFVAFTKRVGDPTPAVNEGIIYTKDVAGDTRPFFDNDTESPVDLTTGSGGEFFGPWTADHDAGGFDLADISNLEFRVTTVKPAASISAVYNEAGGMRYNSGVSENHEWSINDAIELQLSGNGLDLVGSNLLNAQIMQSNATTPADNGTIRLGNAQSIQWRQTGAFNATMAFDAFDDFVFNFNALTGQANFLINAIDEVVLRLRSDNNVVAQSAGQIIFEGDNVTPVNHEYSRISSVIRSTGVGTETGSLQLGVHDAGGNVNYIELRGDNGEIDMFRALVMNTRPVIGIDFLALTEKAGDPPVISNEGVLYTKDVSGDTQLFYDNNTESPVNLSIGGAGIPHLDGNGATDIIANTTDDTKTLRFDLTNKVTGTDTTFIIFGGTDATVQFPAVSNAQLAVRNFNNSFNATQNFGGAGNGLTCTTAAFFDDDVTLGNGTGDLINPNGRWANDLDPSTNGTRDFGFDTLRWRILYLQEFTDIEEGFASGVAPVGTTNDAKIFCRPEGTDTELRVKFQTGDSVLLAVEPP